MIRAQNLDEWVEVSKKTGEIFAASMEKLEDFAPRASDVFISPFGKSGTTWLQQITHGLRSHGDMSFEEITEVTPWIEIADAFGWDLSADHSFSPRIFKSHMDYASIPKGGKYIVSFRNPLNQIVSFYRFMENWWFEETAVSLEEFAYEITLKEPESSGYFFHLGTWLEQQENPNVLLLTYEGMLADFDSCLNRIAHFLQIDLDHELRRIVTKQSSRAFMLEHRTQFDEHINAQRFEALGLTKANPTTSKVTKGSTDADRYVVSDVLQKKMEAAWTTTIGKTHGISTYRDLRKWIDGAI